MPTAAAMAAAPDSTTLNDDEWIADLSDPDNPDSESEQENCAAEVADQLSESDPELDPESEQTELGDHPHESPSSTTTVNKNFKHDWLKLFDWFQCY